jgi:Ca2+-binding RTX toxin-like protein
VENLTLTGTSAINGTGNTLDNVLIGNSAGNTLTGDAGNDVLDGGAGADMLTGGTGNDTYIRDNAGDVVNENANEGTDTVQSSVAYTLGTNVENLTLTGTSAINGTGNASNNTLAGTSATNFLTGLGGNDTYLYSRGGGQDTVVDNSGAADTMLFGATINPLDLIVSRQANDLRIAVYGSTDQVTIQNWYSGTTNQTETVQAGNGQHLASTQVDQLIQAMANFSTQTGLTWAQGIAQQPQNVQTVLAASWH